ncbi:hypothetical protein QM012_002675 [Aureobasidium pullulans]|uniref:FHA domain-containing protein n=1 Tax=Aureobasidium pullulans TaxID=5580 RepID=A0ABR0TAT6_AURPU
MTAPFSHTQSPTRVTVFLHVNAPKGAPSTGPVSRTLVIPERESVLIGRASLTKKKEPASDNALFTCAVMSRSHAIISMPDGPFGAVILEDTGSMHGVYVNGKKILRTEIHPLDDITFGSKVTRGEGEFLPSTQAFNFSEFPLLTPFPATHEGVKLTVNNITRTGATFSNYIDLCESSKTLPPASYRVPDYETDSSKDDSINKTFEQPAVVEYIDLDPVSSPARSHDFVHSEDEREPEIHYSGSDSGSEFDSEYEANDYPENPDELDDDEQSLAESDGSRSRGSSQAWDEEDMQGEQVDSEFDEPEEPEIAPVRVTDTKASQTQAMHTQAEEKEKAREAADIMSLPWILEPADRWNTSAVTLTPNSIMPKISSTSILKDAEIPPISQNEKHLDEVEAFIQDKEKDIEGEDTSLNSQQNAIEPDSTEGLNINKEKEITVPTPTVDELFAKVGSPTGSKRKRDVEDDGHENVPPPLTERKLLKSKFNQQHILKDFFKGHAHTSPRPTKRAKRSTARFALGAFAGAIGGVATVVGVLMTPQCEQLLANWPIS